MSWFYALNNEQKGPVTEQELTQLVQQGAVTGDTLVWKEGQAEWRPYREVAPAPGSPPPLSQAAVGVPGGVVCGECGRSFRPDEVVSISGRNICGSCKPLVVQRLKEGTFVGGASEQIRQEHINHEASIRSVGFLYMLGGVLTALPALLLIASGGRTDMGSMAEGMTLGLVSAVSIATGLGLRALKRWARSVSFILSCIGLLAIPIGTIINGYVLYLLASQKGKTVFSDDYKQTIAETPHIKYKTTIFVWIVLALLLLVVLVGLIGFAFRTAVR